jgi:hypothetical protein
MRLAEAPQRLASQCVDAPPELGVCFEAVEEPTPVFIQRCPARFAGQYRERIPEIAILASARPADVDIVSLLPQVYYSRFTHIRISLIIKHNTISVFF